MELPFEWREIRSRIFMLNWRKLRMSYSKHDPSYTTGYCIWQGLLDFSVRTVSNSIPYLRGLMLACIIWIDNGL